MFNEGTQSEHKSRSLAGQDNGPVNKYFAIMPHIDDDDLDLYEYRLLGHYRKLFGLGLAPETNARTAEATGMGIKAVRAARQRLVDKGRITINELTGVVVLVELIDVMAENVRRYTNNPLQKRQGYVMTDPYQKRQGGYVKNGRGGMSKTAGVTPDKPSPDAEKTPPKELEELKTKDTTSSGVPSDVVVAGSGEPPRTPHSEAKSSEHPNGSTIANSAIVTPSKESIEETPPVSPPPSYVTGGTLDRPVPIPVNQYAPHNITPPDGYEWRNYPCCEGNDARCPGCLVVSGKPYGIDSCMIKLSAPVQQDSIPAAEFEAMLQRAAGMPYRAITVERKWAERIGDGSKRYEVRDFYTDYRGTVVVTISKEKTAYCIVDLVDVVSSGKISMTDEERAFGRWAFELANPRLCEPVPCIGQLGLWTWKGELPPTVATTETVAQRRVIADNPPPAGYAWWFAGGNAGVAHLLKGGKGKPVCKPKSWKHPNPCLPQAAYVLCEDCQRIAAEPKAKRETKPTIVTPLNNAIAQHLQGIDPKLATRKTGLLSQKAAGVWRKEWDKEDLTADDYLMVARTFDPKEDKNFIVYYRGACEGCTLPYGDPNSLEDWYSKYVVWLRNPVAIKQTNGASNGYSNRPKKDYGFGPKS